MTEEEAIEKCDPCPFCRDKENLSVATSGHCARISCDYCDIEGPSACRADQWGRDNDEVPNQDAYFNPMIPLAVENWNSRKGYRCEHQWIEGEALEALKAGAYPKIKT